MSKKPRKTAAKGPAKAAARRVQKVAAKRPTGEANGAAAERIASALETIAGHLAASAGRSFTPGSFGNADAFVWHPDGRLTEVPRVSRVDIDLLKGIDRMRDILIENTERFANGLPANNALLWGARGMGKSSLVKAAHASINHDRKGTERLKLIEIHREDIESLPELMELLRPADYRFIVFCDDLSFDGNDASYKSLKAVLEGGIEGRPENVILYATSNRRHLMPRDMIENERSTAINPNEAIEEKVSVVSWFRHLAGLPQLRSAPTGISRWSKVTPSPQYGTGLGDFGRVCRARAVEWSVTRGARSGRVAWQFTQELAGRLGVRLSGK